MWLIQQDGNDMLQHDMFVQRNAIFTFNTEVQSERIQLWDVPFLNEHLMSVATFIILIIL